MATTSPEPFDQLVTDLQNDQTLRARLASAILSSLYFKTRYYQAAYLRKAGEIIRQDQPRVLKTLCQMGQVKPEIEYEERRLGQTPEYYSMTVPRRTRTNLRTKETTALSEDQYQAFVAGRRKYGDDYLFELHTQCEQTPPSSVVYNWQGRVSAAPTRLDAIAKTIRSKGITLPDGITLAQIGAALPKAYVMNSYTKDEIRDGLKLGGLYDRVIALDHKKTLTKEELIDRYERLMYGDRDLSMALFYIISRPLVGEEFKETAEPETEPITGPTAIAPDYADIKNELNFYTTALSEREELQVLIDVLKSQFDYLYNYQGPLDALARSGSSAAEPELEVIPALIQTDAMNERVNALVESLQTFRAEIRGSSRKPIRDDLTQLVRSFINNWRGFASSYLNGALLGPPGSGKTETARYVGQIFSRLGILGRGEFQTHSRATLVGQYVGETAQKVRRILIGSLENVLFIDEAYSIAQGSSQSIFDPYGIEAINEIVGFLDKYRGKSCLDAAGYACEMERYWFGANPGLRRRTRFVWTMPDLSADEFFDLVRKNIQTWKAQNKALCRTDECDRKSKASGIGSILADHTVGQYLWSLLDWFKPLLTNQGGDAESIADGLISRYYETDTPLIRIDVDQVFYALLEGRSVTTRSRDQGKSCNPIIDEEQTKRMRTAVCALLPGTDPRKQTCQ